MLRLGLRAPLVARNYLLTYLARAILRNISPWLFLYGPCRPWSVLSAMTLDQYSPVRPLHSVSKRFLLYKDWCFNRKHTSRNIQMKVHLKPKLHILMTILMMSFFRFFWVACANNQFVYYIMKRKLYGTYEFIFLVLKTSAASFLITQKFNSNVFTTK